MSTLSCCDVDKLSYSATSDQVSIPEPTELDRILVRVTEAALDATLNTPDANVNNEAAARDCQDAPQAPCPPSKPKTIGRRFRSLFSFGRKSAKASALHERKPLPRLNEEPHGQGEIPGGAQMTHADPREQPHLFQELVEGSHLRTTACARRDDPDGNNNQGRMCGGGGGCRSGAAAASPAAQDQETSPLPQLVNLSNTSDTTPGVANSSDATPGKQQKSQQQPGNKGPAESPSEAGQTGTASTAATRTRLYRGGPTTQGNRRKQEAIFRECRIMPIDTLYKKAIIAPGHERLFVAAPTNLRPPGNPMVYDIAFENSRHHSDCNRDFVRVNLKKLCSNYIKPSQFRYVY